MSQPVDESRIDPPNDAIEPAHPIPSAASVRHPAPTAKGTGAGAGGIALVLALLAAGVGGYAAWRVLLIERGGDNATADLRQRLDAMDTRVIENERRSARANELATTLRDQLSENERLRNRLREDLLALGERSARAEALLADMTRDQRGGAEALATADAGLMLAQADTRLRLFGDRQGALAALALAESSLGQAGTDYADLRSAIADARAAIAADARPSASVLLTELDALADAIDTIAIRRTTETGGTATGADTRGWWSRQFDRFDQLVTVRRETAVDDVGGPTRDGVRNALHRARLAALAQDFPALAPALAAARASLSGCCDVETSSPLLARLDRLIAINWTAPLPDLGALRQRLDDRDTLQRVDLLAPSSPEAAPPSPDPGSAGSVEDTP